VLKYRETYGRKDLFNKSHSMAYAVLCLQTAYLKAHYPAQFFKALLNINKTDNGALNKYIVDAQDFNVEILPPNINKSVADFSIHDNKVLFGLEAVRGIGENFAKAIIDERNANNKFKGLDDFIKRINPGDSQVVALAKAGAFPTKNKKDFLLKYMESSFDNKPFEYKWKKSLPTLLELKTEWDINTDVIKDKEKRIELYNQKREVVQEKEYYIKQKEKYNLHKTNFTEKYLQDEEMWEFESLSVFINNNPFKEIYQYITSFDEIQNGEKCVVVGVISKVVKKKDRNKNQFAYVTVYSATGVIEVTCWASQFSKYQEVLKKDTKLAILCGKKEDKAYLSDLKLYDKWFEDTKMKAKLQLSNINN
jgi:DNA polymerase-3 subunit alpha